MEHRAIRPVAWAEHIALMTLSAPIALFCFFTCKAERGMMTVPCASADRLVLNIGYNRGNAEEVMRDENRYWV